MKSSKPKRQKRYGRRTTRAGGFGLTRSYRPKFMGYRSKRKDKRQ